MAIGGRAAPPRQKVLGVFNGLGAIAFAYSFSAVLLEVQVRGGGLVLGGWGGRWLRRRKRQLGAW